MLVTGLAVLATLLPALASSHAGNNDPHLRHRRLANALGHVEERSTGKALPARANEAHANVHRMIKKSVAKRGQQCRSRDSTAPTPSQASQAPPSSSAAPSPTIDNQNAYVQASSSAWTPPPSSAAPSPSPSPSPSPNAAPNAAPSPSPSGNNGNGGGNNNGGAGISVNVGNLLSISGPCGWCDSNAEQPNGSQDFMNCGINGAGWNPPTVTMDQVIAADFDASSSVFSPCGAYVDIFYSCAAQYNVKPIMLASFAMQESTCNAGATGGNGEAGLMQIAPPNCEAGNNCWDPQYNICRGAQLFRQMIDSNGGNVLLSVGAYNGWSQGMTYGDATAAKSQGDCLAQNNLDYLDQYFNGWLQDKPANNLGSYHNLDNC